MLVKVRVPARLDRNDQRSYFRLPSLRVLQWTADNSLVGLQYLLWFDTYALVHILRGRCGEEQRERSTCCEESRRTTNHAFHWTPPWFRHHRHRAVRAGEGLRDATPARSGEYSRPT